MRGFILIAGVGVASFASADFVRADITYFLKPDGSPYATARTVTVKGPKVVELVGQLPGIGKGKGPLKPAGWKARTQIVLTDDKGRKTKALVSYYGNLWTWGTGNGDFSPGPKLKSLLNRLETTP